MIATAKLRFVERLVPMPEHGGYLKTVRILQQWWEEILTMNMGWGEIPIGKPKGEWRDVPIEKEPA